MIQGLLLDTHIAIWLGAADPRLRPRTRRALDEAWATGMTVYLSPIVIWETAALASNGRVHLGCGIADWVGMLLDRPGTRELPVTKEAAIAAFATPGLRHGDPADRLLVGCAIVAGCQLVTYDAKIVRFARDHGAACGFSVMR